MWRRLVLIVIFFLCWLWYSYFRVKGSDASWLNDIEPPPSHVDYSDDEEERRANKAKKEQSKLNRQESSDSGENSNPPPRRMLQAKRNQRPFESSSRFGGFGRGRGNIPPAFRKTPNLRFWHDHEMRTPPPHPGVDPGGRPFIAPPMFNPPMFPPFNPTTPPPYMMNHMPFSRNPRMPALPPMNTPPPFRQNLPVFGANYCNMPGPQPQWLNRPPPPPGT